MNAVPTPPFNQLPFAISKYPMQTSNCALVNAEHIVLGGNMRLRACQEAGLREVPVIIAGNLTPEQQRELQFAHVQVLLDGLLI